MLLDVEEKEMKKPPLTMRYVVITFPYPVLYHVEGTSPCELEEGGVARKDRSFLYRHRTGLMQQAEAGYHFQDYEDAANKLREECMGQIAKLAKIATKPKITMYPQ